MNPLRSFAFSLAALCTLPLAPAASFAAADISSSALINHALDSQVSDLSIQGGLFDVMKTIEQRTGVRIEAVPAVWDTLPWGQDTSVTAHVNNTTVRQVLDSITRHLGLTYHLGDEAVVLEPAPALRRLGRRATLEEIQALHFLAATPLDLSSGSSVTVASLLSAVDKQLATSKPPLAIDDRAFPPAELASPIHIAPNATLMESLEEIPNQTDATWYPWGKSVVIVKKIEATRLLLTRRLTRRYHDVELQDVLSELSSYSSVLFTFAPGVLQQVPAKYQRVTLTLDDAPIEQILQLLSGATGLKFTPTADAVGVTYSPHQ